MNIEPPSSTWRLGEFAFFTMSRMCEARVDRHVVGLHVELDLGVRDLAVGREEPGAARLVRGDDRQTCFCLRNAGASVFSISSKTAGDCTPSDAFDLKTR